MKKLLLALTLLSYSLSAQTPRVGYEIFIRSFADSDGDGIGDLNGITSRLDYLHDLGIDVLWITPIHPSPSYHKYDVTDYKAIDPAYGTLADYKRLIQEAHRRKIQVVMDLVVNHTSSQHPWFLEAQKGPDNPYRNYYVWLSQRKIDSLGIATRERTGDSHEASPWHTGQPGDREKYYGLFWGGMPDLNFDNPVVRRTIYDIGKYWLKEAGVDGFRLDAAKHIYPDDEAPKSQAFWQEFRKEMQEVKPDVYLVGEIWSTADQVAPYFRGLPANFHFDLCFALQKIARTGHDSSLVRLLRSDYAVFGKENPHFVDATMAGNHDQNRIASILGGDPNRLKVAANLLLTLPGEPWLYYGEEIGMLGQKPDEYIREPFLWDRADRDKARTHWMTPRYSTDATVAPLAIQQTQPGSIYQHFRRLIAFRKSQPALADVVPPRLEEAGLAPQEGLLAFVRPHASGNVLVVHNLGSRPLTVSLGTTASNYPKVKFQSGKGAKKSTTTLSVEPYSVVVLGK